MAGWLCFDTEFGNDSDVTIGFNNRRRKTKPSTNGSFADCGRGLARSIALWTIRIYSRDVTNKKQKPIAARTIDEYLGGGSNETNIDGVYQLTPIPMWYPFSIQSEPMHWIAVSSQAIAMFSTATSIGGTAAILVIFSQSISLQFKIIIYRIRKAEKHAYQLYRMNGGKKLKNVQLYSDPSFLGFYNSNLNKLAEHHSILIKQFYHLYEIGKWPVGLAYLLSSLMIAISLLALMSGDGKSSVLLRAALMVVAEVLYLALVCGQSESVQELGESLHEELYNMNWLDLDTPAKKTIMIMIEQSKRPLVLTAAGLQPLNWEAFTRVMNTAYTYVNLLLAANA
ncbi:hypothetical protein GE061_003478 [Apolygus lucorum]|uniref:Odorant receptor n=2 Tax=Apolygus lucorum TaxID=248454 RepID=A0A8S9X691_APOLU|nr:hypothetical protein GE061_003478 [Apolygus lucorum]